ncbi:alpha-galactosidase [Saccharothrix coeruleofusca]|uniref:NPCBM/NEW2 domain-containing protein n=1 Tax=Saccharothrix coeruleofusca TaxID=33919 RepID=UPI0027DD94A6|nr:NPCBM/NEW2 domain-containing protein [Saccharothrix coeruleofusca]MBP2334038.1 alpha-galactosidase [Saccharothrix coeruleofusca]
MHQRRSPRRGWAVALVVPLAAAGLAVTGPTPAAAAQPVVRPLADGLALTPPMGFNNWNTTHCDAEFNEDMIKGIADIFVSRGLKDAGYEFVNIDDCWALPQRGQDGNLVPDPVRFPNGIKALADYVHAKGLKFGIYTSAGTMTCSTIGFPGSLGHEQQDADLFASWGVDYLKYDNCNNQGVDARLRYTTMRDALNRTGRPIVFSICEWGENRPWEWAKGVGHLWRTTGDISDNWDSMVGIAKFNMTLAEHAGPAHWNDPDMLEVGNGGMTDTEYRTHFSLWAMMAAPLLIGADLREVGEDTFDILTNREIIALDQDRLGAQARLLRAENGLHVLVKPLENGDRAVALFNETDLPARIGTTAREIGLPAASGYRLRDLWAHTDTHTAGAIDAAVPPHGTAVYRVSPDHHWFRHPPAVDAIVTPEPAYPGALPLVTPGKQAKFTTSVGNAGRVPVLAVHVELRLPEGWRARPTSPPVKAVLPGGQRFTTTWEVTPPLDDPPGRYPVTAAIGSAAGRWSFTAEAYLPTSPPSGARQVSDLPWLRASNGWGPVELDRSNGEQAAGDGGPITIGGVTYAKGLGVHAHSRVEYFTGGRCSAFRAEVGVDDEKATDGSVSFEVWADGRKAADSGVLTTADPAEELAADITGATTVRLVVTDGGNGVNSDHADWADASITCD